MATTTRPTLPAAPKPPLTTRDRLAIAAGKSVRKASRVLGRGHGDHLPGRVMLVASPTVARHLAVRPVITLVSATNGKSSITSMLAGALRATGAEVAMNDGGANMMPGLTTALALHANADYAILETDEAVVPRALKELHPGVVVLGELSRDQLDRHHEVLKIARLWREAFAAAEPPLRFVAPVNDPNVVWALAGQPHVEWVDVDTTAQLDTVVCPGCGSVLTWEGERSEGHWSCSCGLVRPTATIVQRGDALTIDGRIVHGTLALPGRFQQANRALAVAAARLLGVAPETAFDATARVARIGVRPPTIAAPGGGDVPIVLVKNPAGWLALIGDMLDGAYDDATLLFVQNDNSADGRDPSWLWDVPYERLAPRRVIASGIRAWDVAVRMDVAGLDLVAVEPDPWRALRRIDAAHGEPVLIAASYTAYHGMLRDASRTARRGGARR
jgi:UDP-N-acetylmuramyl tripeptide synthase